jgi:hypothetical protein
MKKKRLSLGLDLGTQSLSAVLLDIDRRTRVTEYSLDYTKDTRLNTFGIRLEDYILPPRSDGEADQPPLMFLAALDAMFTDLKKAFAMRDIAVEIRGAKWPAAMLIQIHDELLFEVERERAESFGRMVKEKMEGVWKFPVPLKVNVKTGEVKEFPTDGAFLFVGLLPRTQFLKGLVQTDQAGYIITNDHCETSVKGIFAAGDLRQSSVRQVIAAAGDGTRP